MTGTRISSDGLEQKRRRLLFRAWHRGIREMDLIMGRFADAHIHSFTDSDLEAFEELLTVPDQQAYAWISGTEPVPAEFDTPMFRRIREFHLGRDRS